MKRHLLAVVLLVAATDGRATTWHVAQDGSGDFTVIQDAVDAASPGDTVWIHAGRYTDMVLDFDTWGNGSVLCNAHIAVTVDNLTIRGDDPELTIIGPAVYPDDPLPYYMGIVATHPYAGTLEIRDLKIENTRYGVYAATHLFSIVGCDIVGSGSDGIRFEMPTNSSVLDCEFVSCYRGIIAFNPTGHVSISGSRFWDSVDTGVVGAGAETMGIADCQFTGGFGAVDFQQGTAGVVSAISAVDFSHGGLVTSLGGSAEIYDSVFEGGRWGVVSDGNFIYSERSRFAGQSSRTLWISNPGDSSFHDCELINGGGWTVYCEYNGSGDCHVDLTNNDWGTDSADQIAEWVFDSNDDPERCCTVDFVPFQGPVAIEPRSWSSVKGLFRGNGE